MNLGSKKVGSFSFTVRMSLSELAVVEEERRDH